MTRVPWSIFDPIWSRPLVMHNAGFDLSFFMARGIEPLEVHCTMQAVRLLRGHGDSTLTGYPCWWSRRRHLAGPTRHVDASN